MILVVFLFLAFHRFVHVLFLPFAILSSITLEQSHGSVPQVFVHDGHIVVDVCVSGESLDGFLERGNGFEAHLDLAVGNAKVHEGLREVVHFLVVA